MTSRCCVILPFITMLWSAIGSTSTLCTQISLVLDETQPNPKICRRHAAVTANEQPHLSLGCTLRTRSTRPLCGGQRHARRAEHLQALQLALLPSLIITPAMAIRAFQIEGHFYDLDEPIHPRPSGTRPDARFEGKASWSSAPVAKIDVPQYEIVTIHQRPLIVDNKTRCRRSLTYRKHWDICGLLITSDADGSSSVHHCQGAVITATNYAGVGGARRRFHSHGIPGKMQLWFLTV